MFFPPKHVFWLKKALPATPPKSFTLGDCGLLQKSDGDSQVPFERVGYRTTKTPNGEELTQKSRVGSSNLDDFSEISNTNDFKTTKN